jgi:hypothetical protein
MTGPDHRELYLLVGGIVVGMLLGPAVFGRLAPDIYNNWFPSYEQAQADLVKAEQQNVALNILTQGGVDLSSVDAADGTADLDALRARRDTAVRHRGRLAALIVALVAVMIVEVLAAERPIVRRRLTRARYVLAAAWVALLLAQPGALGAWILPMAAIIVAIAIVAAYINAPRPPATDQ